MHYLSGRTARIRSGFMGAIEIVNARMDSAALTRITNRIFPKKQDFLPAIALVLGLAVCLVVSLQPREAAANEVDTIYACFPNESGRVRIVNGPGLCRDTEQEVSWQTGAVLPKIVAVPISAYREQALGFGCRMERFSEIGRLHLIANCNVDSTEPVDPGILAAQFAPDAAYVYDGFYICMGFQDSAVQRDEPFSILAIPRNVDVDAASGDISYLDISTLGLSYALRTSDFPIPATVTDPYHCKRFRFADGFNVFGNGFDEFLPRGEFEILVYLPDLVANEAAKPFDGESLIVQQFGFTTSRLNR